MARLLFLAHRLPYPPNKGDKVRSYHLLRHLTQRHQVYLGTFVDDPEDLRHVATLRAMCAGVHAVDLSPRMARICSLRGLATGEALSLPYYRDAGLQSWVVDTCRGNAIDAAVIFSSAMAQYVEAMPGRATLVDFVDVDSAKWSQYADAHRWPMSWLYRREGRKLLSFERKVAARSARSYFVTQSEADLFRDLAPECADRVSVMSNGVDADYFSPAHDLDSPFGLDEVPVVFTGAMDYWPNIDAVTWFAADVLPALRARRPEVRFHIVGRAPAPSVVAVAGDAVVVSGTVPDVRPYLRHAAAVVAPLRVARGIQNKILEAMAMGRPVVVSEACAGAIDSGAVRELVVARDAPAFVDAIDELLSDRERAERLGERGRQAVVARYSWSAHLSAIDNLIDSLAVRSGAPVRVAA